MEDVCIRLKSEMKAELEKLAQKVKYGLLHSRKSWYCFWFYLNARRSWGCLGIKAVRYNTSATIEIISSLRLMPRFDGYVEVSVFFSSTSVFSSSCLPRLQYLKLVIAFRGRNFLISLMVYSTSMGWSTPNRRHLHPWALKLGHMDAFLAFFRGPPALTERIAEAGPTEPFRSWSF